MMSAQRRNCFALRLAFAALLAAALLASLATPSFAAGGVIGTLRGSVVDLQSNAPIGGVLIAAVSGSGSFRTTTDPKGFFALLQLPTDTYTVTAAKNGYSTQVIQGVTVLGDQSQSVGVVKLQSAPKTIGQVRIVARGAASAFQPSQTVDETTFVGRRVDQALGEKGSTDFNKLVLSAPGVIQNAEGSSTLNAFSIRGSASVEIGYQFDGVDFRGNFFDENPNAGYLNGIGGGRGALQVVSGAGDATQGGIGAGVVNIIPGRGSYKGDGFVSFDLTSPWYDHGFAFQYGTGTKDGRISDFFSVRSDRSAPQVAPYGRDASDAGLFHGTSLSYDDDLVNNFYLRFGRDQNQELQVLTSWWDHRAWANYGGLQGSNYYPYDPFSYQQYQTDGNGASMWGVSPNPPAGVDPQLAWYQSVIPYVAGVPTTQQPVTQPEQILYGPNNFLKIGYTRTLNATTALNAFFYNWGGLVSNNITATGGGNSQTLTTGAFFAGYNNVGGRRVGYQAQLTKQLGQIHTLTLVGKFENGFPYWNQPYYANTWVGFTSGRGQDQNNGVIPAPPAFCPSIQQCVNGPRVEDWFLPQTPGLPVTLPTGSNPCIGPAIDNGFSPTAGTALGCYIYSWMLANGKWNGKLPSIPLTGFTYAGTDFQQYGIGIRDQWTPNSQLHIDYGFRLDGQHLRWGPNLFSKDLGNPSDVGLGYASIGNDYLRPQLIEPRVAIDYIVNPNNSVRFSYGRSVSFYFAQTAGTPTTGIMDPLLYQIPAKDNGSPLGPACGSGWHGSGTNGNGMYSQNPDVPFSGGQVLGNNVPGWYFPCPNYASSVYWLFDQTFAAPDIGGGFPATYNNYDLAWEHQFRNGWGTKLTSYWRRGFNTYQVTLLNNGPPDPVTGAQNSGSFQVRETGIQKTFGLEFYLTTPDKPAGWSGFLTMNYVNELTNTPPVSGADSLPTVSQFLYQTNTLFHQSYLPPFSARSGVEYRTRSGWRLNPIFSLDGGIPFGVGKDAIGFINGVLYHLPTSNIGIATPYAGPGNPNQAINATCYVDPAFPGSYLHPRDFACRGYDEPALAGQKYTRPRLYTDLNLQFEHNRETFGVYVANLFDNYRSEPGVNQSWQPVANGQGGLQTGQFAGAYPLNPDGSPNAFYYNGARDVSRYDEYWLPFNRAYVPGISYRFYAQFKL
ncbi:MAG: Plug and carboxypeptidase regulatory-like domain-containing protein [Candidatus Eremiobacteraeota bacterium]|nr:Plug and carboxypeptidase regulatory-like domain-containing protein [Candidatus Eremiobacteraeota bacterium]